MLGRDLRGRSLSDLIRTHSWEWQIDSQFFSIRRIVFSSDIIVNHQRALEPLGRTLLRTVIFSGQVCGSSHRALRMSAALVPFLVPQTMQWDLGEGFAVGVVVEGGGGGGG